MFDIENNNDYLNIEDFINFCDDMIKGKFIMADSKIAKILESVAKNENLYNLVNDSLQGYNFQKEYENALNDCDKGIYETPEDIENIIAFVMCLFVEVDHHRIRFYDFINRFFKNAGPGNEYAEFVKTMLLPFKDGIVERYKSYSLITNPEDSLSFKFNKEENIYYQIIEQLKLLRNEVDLAKRIFAKKKEEIFIFIDGCVEAVKYKNLKLISALITALDKDIHGVKELKNTYNNLTNLYLKLYI